MNRRLLKYPLNGFNYKTKKKAYINRWFGRLLANYFLNEYNIESFVHVLKKYSDRNFFKILEENFPNEYISLQEKYGLDFKNNNERVILFDLINGEKYCPECNTRVLNRKNIFCSVKCSNNFKAKDPGFIKVLSESMVLMHENLADEDKIERYEKVSSTILEKMQYMTDEERKGVFTNLVLRYTAFENLKNRYNFTPVCSEEFYYNNRYIPVKCNTCGNEWEFTKSTSNAKTECRVCLPYQKHKTQNEIAEICLEFTEVLQDTKKLIRPLEIDIYCPEFNFAIEYNGLMFHSDGPEGTDIYGDTPPDFHQMKTQLCEDKGIMLYHIFEHEWLNPIKKEIWLCILYRRMKINIKNFDEIIFKGIEQNEAKEFLDLNHLEGYIEADHYGAFSGEDLIAVVSVQNEVIIRVSIKNGFTIKNFDEKIFKGIPHKYILLNRAFEDYREYPLYTVQECTEPEALYFDKRLNILEEDSFRRFFNSGRVLLTI